MIATQTIKPIPVPKGVRRVHRPVSVVYRARTPRMTHARITARLTAKPVATPTRVRDYKKLGFYLLEREIRRIQKEQGPRPGKRLLLSQVKPQDLQDPADVIKDLAAKKSVNGAKQDKSHLPADVAKMMVDNEKDFDALAEKLAGGVEAKAARLRNETEMIDSLWQDAKSLIAEWGPDWTRRPLSGDFYLVRRNKKILMGYKHPAQGEYELGDPGDTIRRRPVRDAFAKLKRHLPGLKEKAPSPANKPLSYVVLWRGKLSPQPCKQIKLHENALSYQNGGDQRVFLRYAVIREMLAKGEARIDHAEKLPEDVRKKLGLVEEEQAKPVVVDERIAHVRANL